MSLGSHSVMPLPWVVKVRVVDSDSTAGNSLMLCLRSLRPVITGVLLGIGYHGP